MTEPPGCRNSGHPEEEASQPTESSSLDRNLLLRQLAELRAQEYRLLSTQVQRKAQMRKKLRGHMPAVNVADIEDLRRILTESQSRMEYVAQHSFIPVY